jgi:AcrR family transcriptional regulator
MARPKLSHQIDLQQAIKDTALRLIGENGAASLSLRAIARALHITAPAIYNHFPNRDALVTALIIDAYADFGDSQLSALESIPADDLKGRLMAVGMAYRNWALKYPERYHLIFGSPIPGYVAPQEQVKPVASRSLTALVSVLEALRIQNKLQIRSEFKVEPEKLEMFAAWKKVTIEADIQTFSLAILIWARVHGLVFLEISNGLPPFGPSPETLYLYEMDSIGKEYIKE